MCDNDIDLINSLKSEVLRLSGSKLKINNDIDEIIEPEKYLYLGSSASDSANNFQNAVIKAFEKPIRGNLDPSKLYKVLIYIAIAEEQKIDSIMGLEGVIERYVQKNSEITFHFLVNENMQEEYKIFYFAREI